MRRRRGADSLRRIVLAGTMVLAVWPAGARAAEWRLFGVDSLSGHLAWIPEAYQEQAGELSTHQQSLEQQARLRLSSYVLHPRFLSLTADTLFALRSGNTGNAGLRNLDSGVTLDFLREHMLTFGGSGRSRQEEFEQDYQDYARDTVGGAAYACLAGSRLAASVRYEVSDVLASKVGGPESGALTEDKHIQYLSAESSLRLPSVDSLALRYRAVNTEDALGTSDSRYQTAELSGSQSVLNKRGKLTLGLIGWQTMVPTEEQKVTFTGNLQANWTPRFRSTEDFEVTRRLAEGAESTMYRAGVSLNQDLSDRWSVQGNLGATRNLLPSSENYVYRAAGGLGYRGEWRGYKLGAQNMLSVSQAFAGPDREFLVYDEKHSLPTNGYAEVLANPYIDINTIEVTNESGIKNWKPYCYIYQVGTLTYIAWRPTDEQKKNDPNYPQNEAAGQLIDVWVHYHYVLPETNYAELTHQLSFLASRELERGAFVESGLTFNTTVPGTKGPGLEGLDYANARSEVGFQGTLKRPAYELGAGATVGRDRKVLNARASTTLRQWVLSESYRSEFYPDLTGHYFDTKASRLWGVNEKTHLQVEVADQMGLVNGRQTQGLTAGRLRTVYQLSPFMRFELEGRGEYNRVVQNDTKCALDVKYVWQQGQLDLTAGYEFRIRTFDRFTSHRLYATVIRRF
ncbi:MAG: hypothetical protein ACM3XZ_08700 [Betaproteobacteria bacterium]